MFCNLVNAYINYENTHSLMALQVIESISENILYDLQDAIIQSRPLIEKYRDLFNNSTTFIHFLTRLSKMDFVGKTSVDFENNNLRKMSFGDDVAKTVDGITKQIEKISKENTYFKSKFEEKVKEGGDNRNSTLGSEECNEEETRLKDDHEECNEEKTQLKDDLEECNKEKTQLKDDLKKYNKENTQLKDDLEECNKEKTQLKDDLKECNKEKTQLKDDLEKCNKEKTQLKDDLKECNEEKTKHPLAIGRMECDSITHSEKLKELEYNRNMLVTQNQTLNQEINHLKENNAYLMKAISNFANLYHKNAEELNGVILQYKDLMKSLTEKDSQIQLAIQTKNEYEHKMIKAKQDYDAEYLIWQNMIGFVLEFTKILSIFERIDIKSLEHNIQSQFIVFNMALAKFKEYYTNVFAHYNIAIPPPPISLEDVITPPQQQSTMTIEQIGYEANKIYLTWEKHESQTELQNRYNKLERENLDMQNQYERRIQELITTHESIKNNLNSKLQEMINLNDTLKMANIKLQDELQNCQEHITESEEKYKILENEKQFLVSSNVLDDIKDKLCDPLNTSITKLYKDLCIILKKTESDNDIDFMMNFIRQTVMDYATKFIKMQDTLKSIMTPNDNIDVKLDGLLNHHNYIMALLSSSYAKLNNSLLPPYSLDKSVINMDESFPKIVDSVTLYCENLLKKFTDSIYKLNKLFAVKLKKIKTVNFDSLVSEMDTIILQLEKRIPKPKAKNKYEAIAETSSLSVKKREAPVETPFYVKKRSKDPESEDEQEEEDMDSESITLLTTINELLIIKYFELFYDYVITRNYEPQDLTILYSQLKKVESCKDYENFITAQFAVMDSLKVEKIEIGDSLYKLFPKVNKKLVRFFDNVKDKIVGYIKVYAVKKP